MSACGIRPWTLRIFFTVAAIGWMALIFFLSSLSPSEINQSPYALVWLGHLRDAAGHLVIYAILAVLLYLSFQSWRSSPGGFLRWALAAVVLSLLYGISDEYHQSTVPGRTASVLDVLLDSGGAILGVAALKLVSVYFKHPVRRKGIRYGITGHHE